MTQRRDPVRRSSSRAAATSACGWRARSSSTHQIKLIERDPRRARRASEILQNAIVLQGDAADEELMLEENIDSADVFAALTNSDEANVMAAMLAKRLGASRVMALVNRASYAELMDNRSIDVVISPQTITIGSLLAHVRRGDVVRVHSLRRDVAEAIEVVVHGTGDSRASSAARGSPAAGGREHRRDRARRGGHHGAPRHRRDQRGSPDRVSRRSAPRRSGRTAVPGRALGSQDRCSRSCTCSARCWRFLARLRLPIGSSLVIPDGPRRFLVSAVLAAGRGIVIPPRRCVSHRA